MLYVHRTERLLTTIAQSIAGTPIIREDMFNIPQITVTMMVRMRLWEGRCLVASICAGKIKRNHWHILIIHDMGTFPVSPLHGNSLITFIDWSQTS